MCAFLQHLSIGSQRERAKSATLTKYLQKLHIFHCLSKGRQRERAKRIVFPKSLQNIYIRRFTRTSFLCACPGVSPQRRFASSSQTMPSSLPCKHESSSGSLLLLSPQNLRFCGVPGYREVISRSDGHSIFKEHSPLIFFGQRGAESQPYRRKKFLPRIKNNA